MPIRLKSDSIPNTDRATGIFADPLCQNDNTRQPPRVREQTSRAASSEVDDVMFNPGPSCPADSDLDIDLQNIEDEDYMISNGSETGLDEDLELDSDTDYRPEMHNSSFSDEDSESEAILCMDPDADQDVQLSHTDVETFTAKASWALVNIPLLLSLLKFCPQCGALNEIKKIDTQPPSRLRHRIFAAVFRFLTGGIRKVKRIFASIYFLCEHFLRKRTIV